MKKPIYLQLLIIIFTFLCFWGCDGEETQEPPEPPIVFPDATILINHFWPSRMPVDSFYIYIYAKGMGNIDTVRIVIESERTTPSICFDTTLPVNTRHISIDTAVTDSIRILVPRILSGCFPIENVYRIRLISKLLNKETDMKHYVKGNPILTTRYVQLDRWRMDVVSLDSCQKIRNAIDSTYNYYNVKMDTSNTWKPIPTFNFPNLESNSFRFLDLLDSVYYANYVPSAGEYKIIAASHCRTNIGNRIILGVTPDSSYSRKYAYVFVKKIDSIAPLYTPKFYPSSLNGYVAVHELLHLIGRMTRSNEISPHSEEDPFNEHIYHRGRFKDSCVFHSPTANASVRGFLTRKTGFFKICDHHIYKLRERLGSSNYELEKTTISGNFDYSDLPTPPLLNSLSNYKIEMTLPKKSYYKFEPVIAEFKVINNNKKPINIYGLFSTSDDKANIQIHDNKGNKWTKNNIDLSVNYFYTSPDYIIQSLETLYVSMPINNWGQSINHYYENKRVIYFDQWGYFPPGKYYAQYYIKSEESEYYKANMKSNVVEFDVIDNNNEQTLILNYINENIYKMHPVQLYHNLKYLYPNNTFSEYIEANLIKNKHEELLTGFNYEFINDLDTDYLNFFAIYPNSLYLLDDSFISLYLFKEYKINIKQELKIKSIKEKIKNSLLDKYFKNSKRVENILSLIY